ncbi:uncharacterized protein LOC135701579 [Ochlerotatus camptorhynchus]|uniref:uncharacterized protein LOC135701579 n=1 Tax=Ochlerotatus camptorhynchus TaxID=644619 RepID=UPI0031D74B75
MDSKEEIIVDDMLCNPEYVDEADENPGLRQLITEFWRLDPAIYAILIAHGYTVEYLKILDEKALNDVFSVAKWTGHKYALRQKLLFWEESVLFQKTVAEIEPVEVERSNGQVGVPETTNRKLIPTTVTKALLDTILERNEKGKIVSKYHQLHQHLDKTHRKFLAHTIVDYYIANQLYFSLPDMARFAELITDRFPAENTITYYNPRDSSTNKKHPSGMLYDRFHKRKKTSVLPNVRKPTFFSEQKQAAAQLPQEEINRLDTIKVWLRNNFATSDIFSKQWKDSILLRLRSIHQDRDINKITVLTEWPRYLDENGYLLVDVDFNFLYEKSDEQCKLFNKWEWFCTNFNEYILSNNLRDHYSLHLLSLLEGANFTQDTRDFVLCSVFHGVIKPVRTSAKKLPTILQAQLDTCFVCETQEDFAESLDSLREEYETAGIPFSPRVYAIGTTNHLECFYVVTNKLLYKLPSLVRCLDVVVKLKFTLDLQFPESCELFWALISRYFYNIEYNNKSRNTQILQLITHLESHEQ